MMNTKPLKPRTGNLTPQESILLNMLKRGEVTRLAAITAGIANVTARVADLRARGFNVVATMQTDTLGRRYARWSLRPAPRPTLSTMGLYAEVA